MKRNIKITAYILAILILSTLITAGIYAYSFTDVTKYQEAVETLNSIGVITGRTATQFSPDENVTRWQMALLMTKMMTGNIDNSFWAASSETIVFEDVTNNIKHYGGSIAYAVKHGIIIGRSDTVFSPEDGITLQDAATIMVRALGYPRSQYDAGYPDSYIEKANSLGLFAELTNVSATDTLTRGETAQLLYNAFKAPKRIGNTIAEDVFGYSESVIVLTATPEMRISSRVTLAAAGKLVFCELKPDGTLDTSAAFSLPASDFNLADANDFLGKSYRVTSVLNYGKILAVSECESKILTQNTVSELLTVVSNTGKHIKLGNTTYEVVSKYSYALEENVIPQSRQIIVYGAGETYETSAVLSASDIYGTNAYYILTTYDDNNDGFPDRALYRPYSFALYTRTGNDVKLEGAMTHNLKANAVNLTGASAATGSYVIYSYIPAASSIDILKVLTVNNGTIVNYNADSINIRTVISAAAAGTEYKLGNNNLRGAYTAAVKNIFTANPTVSYVGSNLKYIADGLYVLMIDVSAPQDSGTATGYVSQQNCAVIKTVDNSNVINGYITLTVYYMDGTTGAMYVRVINGNLVNYASMNTVAAGDIIEYAVYQPGTPTSISYYSVVNISSKPFVSSGINNSNLYFLGADLLNIGLGYKTASTQTSISYYGTLRMSSDIKVIFYNGYIFEDITSGIVSNPNYQQQILPNYSMYASYGTSGSNAKLVYIRHKYTAPANTPGTTEHSKILYISAGSIMNRTQESGTIYYSAFDFMEGKYVSAEYGLDLTNQYATTPQLQGYYKASVNIYNENRYMLKEPNPVTADILNTNITFAMNTALTNLSKAASTYTLYLGGIRYTTTALNIYKFNNEGIIIAADVSSYYTNQTTYTVDVFMKPANALSNSDRIALLIR